MFRNEQTNVMKPSAKFVVIAIVCLLLFAAAHIQTSSKAHSNVSWYSWLTGTTLSYDFHYLDLLELLYRGHDSTSE
ncbi:hypothetical protein DRW07_09790 [Alteromonas sediminis]|uniref:Uncharacterized protein n=1 Tax=Alteromonas sediminis TaxID=2259342 RepID=A0A3N5Y1I8_9ALTE|nr:hypothetical protein DRW07_09790 [Alteromonas sediminis]